MLLLERTKSFFYGLTLKYIWKLHVACTLSKIAAKLFVKPFVKSVQYSNTMQTFANRVECGILYSHSSTPALFYSDARIGGNLPVHSWMVVLMCMILYLYLKTNFATLCLTPHSQRTLNTKRTRPRPLLGQPFCSICVLLCSVFSQKTCMISKIFSNLYINQWPLLQSNTNFSALWSSWARKRFLSTLRHRHWTRWTTIRILLDEVLWYTDL